MKNFIRYFLILLLLITATIYVCMRKAESFVNQPFQLNDKQYKEN